MFFGEGGGGGGGVGILSQSGERELNMVYQRKLGRKGASGGGLYSWSNIVVLNVVVASLLITQTESQCLWN